MFHIIQNIRLRNYFINPTQSNQTSKISLFTFKMLKLNSFILKLKRCPTFSLGLRKCHSLDFGSEIVAETKQKRHVEFYMKLLGKFIHVVRMSFFT